MVHITKEEIERILAKEINHDSNNLNNPFEVHVAHTSQELREGKRVIVDAFMDYAMFEWLLEDIKDPSHRRSSVSLFAGFIQRLCCFSGIVLVAKDKTTGKVVGCAHVNHKNRPVSFPRRIWNMVALGVYLGYHLLFGAIGFPWFFFKAPMKKYSRRGIACKALDIEHDKVLDSSKEHLHLIQIAADPNNGQQSKGVGGSLLNAVHAIQRAYGLPTYLETDTERHRKYYERHGFKVEIEYDVDAGDGDVFKPNFGMVRWV